MSTAETTTVLATAHLEPTEDSNKEAHAADNDDTKTSDVPDASTSLSSAEPSCVPAVEDSSKPLEDASKSSPADNMTADEDKSKEPNTSSAESENEKITISPAKDEMDEEIVDKGTFENYILRYLDFLLNSYPYVSCLQRWMLLKRKSRPR
jgi:hypothetical protein